VKFFNSACNFYYSFFVIIINFFMRIFLKIVLLISVIVFPLTLRSQTIIPGGFVSGNWDSVNSPYLIRDDILVHPDSTLMIGAGTTVLFSGPYLLEVQGQLLVNGTPSLPVSFDRENDAADWHGIYFNTTDTSITDSSILKHGAISHCFQRPCLAVFNSGRLRVSDFILQHGVNFRGGGISCINSSPYLEGLLVQYNNALDGAGISLENSSPVLKNCTITQNAADGAGGGIVIFNAGAPYLENCTISQNQSFGSGGGIYINAADPVFVRCHIQDNEGAMGGGNLYSGGGVSVKLGANPYFENCSFLNNYSHREGGGISSFSVTRLVNCLFNENAAGTWGGGVFLSSGNLISSPVTNCSFADNEGAQGTAVATHNHKAVVRNCILWTENPLNPGSLIFLDSQFSWNLLDMAYSDIQNGQTGIEDSGTTQYTWGPGNIDLDPFLDPETYELEWNSPCIEAGTPDTTGLGLPEADLAGNPRIANDRVDMGVFEYQSALTVPGSGFQVPEMFQVFPNPSNQYVSIRYPDIFGNEEKEIIIYNSLGIPVKIIDATDEASGISVDISELPAGMYFVALMVNGKKTGTGKLLVMD
jgi:parallel beta-helix repeat protein